MEPVVIVAEMSANHNGSLKTAVQTIIEAKKAGADAIKLQTYTADSLTLDCDGPDFMANPKGLWAGRRLYDLYKEAYTPWDWHKELFHVAKEEGIICFSSPFDKKAVDLLESLDNPIYKVASPEIFDVNLIEYIAEKRKPIVLSSGIALREDLELAIDTCRKVGNNEITLLKCTTAYPTPIEDCNLCMIREYIDIFKVKSGLSDHTYGSIAPILSVAYGASMIEKHFIIDHSIGGVDAAFSMNKDEFKQMVESVRMAEKAIGTVSFELSESMAAGRRCHRSLYVAEDMKKGETINESNVRSVRPGYGLHPKFFKDIIGKQVNKDLKKGTRFSMSLIK